MNNNLENKNETAEGNRYFAVIDTETNFDDDVMSIGVVVADSKTKRPVDGVYYIIDPAYKRPALYSSALTVSDSVPPLMLKRGAAIQDIKKLLQNYEVKQILAYNASFDYKHLPELYDYTWYDIMRLAAYRQFNSKIPDTADCFSTGKLRSGYKVENILRMLRDDSEYSELHNAYTDALDELDIVRLLGHDIEVYEQGKVNKNEKPAVASETKQNYRPEPQKEYKPVNKPVNKPEPQRDYEQDLSYPDPDSIDTDKLWAKLTSSPSNRRPSTRPVSDALENGAIAVLKMISKGLK